MIRALIRRWLGVQSPAEIREQVLREIDADAVWRAGPTDTPFTARRGRAHERTVAIMQGNREDTRV